VGWGKFHIVCTSDRAQPILDSAAATKEKAMSTKKDEQRRIKEEKHAAELRKSKLGSLLAKVAACILIPLVVGVVLYGFFTNGQAVPPGAVGEADHVRGNAAAAVTVTVYADFQCPACREETNLVARAWPRIREKVAFVFRHYPLDIHNHAFTAARYAEAAAKQGKFWEMHDILYADQALWSAVDDPLPFFDGYATQLSLNVEQLHADMDLPEVRAKILADQRGGTRARVLGTPTIFINGRPIPNPATPADLIAAIDKAAAG